jgi:hypothetical protein
MFSFCLLHTTRFWLFCSPLGNDKMVSTGAMKRAAFTVAVVFLFIAATAPEVIFVSPLPGI